MNFRLFCFPFFDIGPSGGQKETTLRHSRDCTNLRGHHHLLLLMNIVEKSGAAAVRDAATVGRRHRDSTWHHVAAALRQGRLALVLQSHVFRL